MHSKYVYNVQMTFNLAELNMNSNLMFNEFSSN